uniref:Uncharacterized protein n=1 Tax=viral metagenome TaxID=1070528 RepID=A0A6C0JKJ4_9ZZZZ
MNEIFILLLLVIIVSGVLTVIILVCYSCLLYVNYLLDNSEPLLPTNNPSTSINL